MKYFADPKLLILDNGIEVYVVERPEQPSAEIFGCVRTGSIDEGQYLGYGLSHFVEHMLFQGCKDYPGTSAGDELGKLGGDANAYTSFDRTVYYVELPGKNVQQGLAILSRMIRYPEFPEERFAAERDVILRESAMGFDNPSRRVGELCRQMLFRQHALRHPIIGYPELVAQVTADMAKNYHAARYTPGRVFFVIAGAVESSAAADTLNQYLGDWARSGLAEAAVPQEPPQFAMRKAEIAVKDPLARLMLAVRIPGVSGSATAPYEVASGLLGAGDAAHLVRTLQFERELAVDLDSSVLETAMESMLFVSAAAEPGKIDKLSKALLLELAKIRKNGVKPAEVNREKLQHKMETLRELRTNAGIAGTVAGCVLSGNAPEAFDAYMDRVDQLTCSEINEAFQTMLDPEHFCLAVQVPERTVRRKKAPETHGTCGAKLLKNGAVYLPNRELPICDMTILLPGGHFFTPSDKAGVNAICAELLTAGSGKWSEDAIAEKLDALGADLTIAASANSFAIRANAPKAKFQKFAGFLAEILAAPDFPERVFERERRAMLAEDAAKAQKPAYASRSAVREMLYGSHPYANNVYFSRTLPSLTVDDARNFYRRLWMRDRTVFAFGGDLRENEALQAMDLLQSALPLYDGDAVFPARPRSVAAEGRREIALDREQQVVSMGMFAPECLDDRDYPAFQVLCDSLNGITGRLYKVIREQHALAYATGMALRSGFHPGEAIFHASTAPETGDQVEELLRQVFCDLMENGLTAAEFEEARNNELFALDRIWAQPEESLMDAALSLYYGRGIEDIRRTRERLQELTLKELNAVIKRRFSGAKLQIARAGNLGKTK
ncbi:MAG: insulinase family protein [Lentisphaeria bacterium]|nr:insulinase family protein [Lentisphaeria bacterium]